MGNDNYAPVKDVQLINTAVPLSCQILERNDGYFDTNLHLKNQYNHLGNNYILPGISDAYSCEPWQHVISVNNKIFSESIKNKPVFVTQKDTVKQEMVFGNQIFHKSDYPGLLNNTILLFLIVSFFLLAWVRVVFGKYLNQILRSLFTYSEAFKLFRDSNALIERVYIILNIIFIFSGGLFCFHILRTTSNFMLESPFLLLSICFLFILTLYILRYFNNKLLGFILLQRQTFDEYLHNSFIYYKAVGLFLLPLTSIITFISSKHQFYFLVFGVFVISLLYLASIFRGTRIMLQKGILLFYWILYLCTMEFLPIALFYKVIKNIV